MRCLTLLMGLACAVCSMAQIAQPITPERPVPFDSYICQDALGRTIRFYVSPAPPGKPLPLAVWVGGSGGQSIWPVREGQVQGGLQNLLQQVAANRFRVLAVEKPGVPFGFQDNQPGTATGATAAFCEEHTLDRWVEAIRAATRAAHKLPGVSTERTLAIGHSEGGLVVARLAALEPSITHVASLAGGGPTQLSDLMTLFGREKAEQLWRTIQADPMSGEKQVWGHPHRRWTTFMATSIIEEAVKSKAKFYIAQGSEDRNSLPGSALDVYATLLTRGRHVTLDWINGADHSFEMAGTRPTGEGFQAVMGRVAEWYLAP